MSTDVRGIERVPWYPDQDEDATQHIHIEWVMKGHVLDFKVLELYDERGEIKTHNVAHGFLKWDGCLNIGFVDTQERMFHFCGPEDDPLLGRIVKAIYALGPKMPHWDA